MAKETTLGDTLRAFREKKKRSLYRVAGNAELSTSVVHNAENDVTRRITFETLRRIVVYGLEMSMGEFIEVWERGQRPTRKVAA